MINPVQNCNGLIAVSETLVLCLCFFFFLFLCNLLFNKHLQTVCSRRKRNFINYAMEYFEETSVVFKEETQFCFKETKENVPGLLGNEEVQASASVNIYSENICKRHKRNTHELSSVVSLFTYLKKEMNKSINK